MSQKRVGFCTHFWVVVFFFFLSYYIVKEFYFPTPWRRMMSRKVFAQVSVLVLLLLAFFAIPAGAQAGGVCGGPYVVDAGDTLNSIAARCGTSVSAITTANSGVADPLRPGQTLNLPGSGPSGSSISSSIVSSDPTYTNTSNNYTPPPQVVTYSSGTYVVQYGDTFSAIASRHGLSINQLWAANPYIGNINLLYAGQVITIPGYSSGNVTNSSDAVLSYGSVPAGTNYGEVRLVNRSGGDIYVSLQGTTRDGISVIYEYPVSGTVRAKVPVGWYPYVAWVGGVEYVGEFNLSRVADHSIIFRINGATDE
jgi:LysM repeat protein